IPRTSKPDLKFKNPPDQPPGQPNVHPSTGQLNPLAGREVNVPRIYGPPVRPRQPFAEEAGSIVFIGINPKSHHKRREGGRARAIPILVESEIGDQPDPLVQPDETGPRAGSDSTRRKSERLIRTWIQNDESTGAIDSIQTGC